jgi:hypothetical protein
MVPVDVLTVLGPGREIHKRVLSAMENQGNVKLEHHILNGDPMPGENRIVTIARARNRAKELGDAHYAMFLDDDVVLPPRGIEKLVYALIFNPRYAAIGIDYQNYTPPGPWAIHVAMGAIMFIRPILERIHFRVEPNKCECYCCCDDIRRMGYLVDYLPGLRAEHLK